jgi:acyl carrier protein
MAEMKVKERVINTIAATLGVDPEKIASESSLMDDLGADSLDRIEIIMALEEEFDIGISDDEVQTGNPVGEAIMESGQAASQGLMIVKDIIKFIEKKTANKPVL